MSLEVVDELVEIIGQRPYYAAKFLNCWNNIIVGRLKEFGYMNMWSTWIHSNMSPIMIEED